MLAQYAYVKPRSQFGKQCVFEKSGIVAQENVLPEPECMRDYIIRSHTHSAVQKSTQFAVHEVQTSTTSMKNTGMFHMEGGWPKEINPRDEEVVQRYRRRVEKDDNWISTIKLFTVMEGYINQNNAVNIYENYFDDMIPTPLKMEYDVRTWNVYEDPQPNVRPVSHLSWSPGKPNRLAASYSFMEFEVIPADVNPYSYIWDIENSNVPFMALKSSSPVLSLEFNPRDPSMLISGLMTGQVCNWDIRTGDKPVQISHLLFSHRNPANQTFWIASKTNTEFFSASTSGTLEWWDIRNLRKPTDTLVMDLEDPTRADVDKAIGISALQFEPTMGSRFMAGTQNGIVVNVNRKGANVVEKLAMRFNCYTGPVVTIDRNPFSLQHFLTVGDWTGKIWADDTREGCLVSTTTVDADLTGGCWSRSRYSVFFIITAKGILKGYDILTGLKLPLTTFRVCDYKLTTISPHEDGQLLGIGSKDGNIYLVECSEGLLSNSKNDKAALSSYLERCSRFEKAVDNRLKEIRLMMSTSVHKDSVSKEVPVAKSKDKKRDSKEKVKPKESDKGKIEPTKKKSRAKKMGREFAFSSNDSQLVEAEVEFFRIIESESAKYDVQDFSSELSLTELQDLSNKRKKRKESVTKDVPAKERKPVREKSKSRIPKSSSKLDQKSMELSKVEEVGAEEADETASTTEKQRRRRKAKIPKKICPDKVCKPEICCTDMEGVKTRRRPGSAGKHTIAEDDEPLDSKTTSTKEKWQKRLIGLVEKIPEFSEAEKERILIVKDAPPDVIQAEAEEARKKVRSWQKEKSSEKHSFEGRQLKPVKQLEVKSEENIIIEDGKESSITEVDEQPTSETSGLKFESVIVGDISLNDDLGKQKGLYPRISDAHL